MTRKMVIWKHSVYTWLGSSIVIMMKMRLKTFITILFIANLLTSCLALKPTTPISTIKSVIISYKIYVDGGDELVNCLKGNSQPQFILYDNGRLVVYKNGQYWDRFFHKTKWIR